MKHIIILTGAGVSAESGIKTFRDEDGLWEGHDIMEIASPQGWEANQLKVLDFYNKRRRQLLEVSPNPAHYALVKLEEKFKVSIITQNVDDLHERAGSTKVLHLHGELLKVRSSFDENQVMDWRTDLRMGDLCKHNHQLRPHVVWFGEAVPMFEKAAEMTRQADILLVIGTSMQVYPAAGLLNMVRPGTKIYFIDPKPSVYITPDITIIEENATTGVPKLVEKLLK